MALTEEGIIQVPGLASRWVRLANGAKAHYMTAGDTGPAVILLHGGIVGSSGTAGWRFMMPYLAERGFRVYAPDQPGFGWADTREEYWPRQGTLDHVQFVNDFADALSIDRFHLSGNSMGATNTAHYVVEHPERVISYILIATYLQPELGLDDDGSRRAALGGIQIPAFTGTTDSMRDLMEPIIYRKEAISQDLLEMRTQAAIRQKDSNAALVAARNRILSDPNLKQKWMLKNRLDRLTIPAIYLYGQNDVLIPVEAGYEQEDYLPNIKFYYPAATGHQGQTDSPELHNRAFYEFFSAGKLSPELEKEAGVSTRRETVAAG